VNVSTITMPKEQATAKLRAYQEQLRRRADAEYEAAEAGYAALAAGTPLLNLTEAFAQTGLGQDGRPKLAIARADRRQVTVTVRPRALVFNSLRRSSYGYNGSLVITIHGPGANQTWKSGHALVPMVPADVRPNANLRDYFILWEVEEWSDRPLLAQPDRDPYLLKHLAGDLYVVVAEWDLTELERAIMTGRRGG
jgi:hypothetical protein